MPGKIIYFEASTLPSCLRGIYNQENIGAAVALSRVLKISAQTYKKAIKNFKKATSEPDEIDITPTKKKTKAGEDDEA